MISTQSEKWMKSGIAGKLIGTFATTDMYGAGSTAEIYWINDPECVGLRYPDNSRMTVGKAWLTWRDKEIQDKFTKYLWEWRKATGWKPSLKLKPKPKAGLKLNSRGAPRGMVKVNGVFVEKGDLYPEEEKPKLKPKLKLKLKLKSK